MDEHLRGLLIISCSVPVLPLYAWTIPSVLTTAQLSSTVRCYGHILPAFYSYSSNAQSCVTSGTGLRMFLRGVQQLDIVVRIAQYVAYCLYHPF
jgi:hypothetical protein